MTKQQATTFEDMVFLDSLAIKRTVTLENIATNLLLEGYIVKTSSEYIAKIRNDNRDTDTEMTTYFAKGLVASPNQFREHIRACVEGSVTECICNADRVLYDEIPF